MTSILSVRELVSRTQPPEPWSEGDNIPWDDPEFSRRMLREHLSQDHDLASRRVELVRAHVDWIHDHVLARSPSRILDLGCGPGLYTHRLARLGHDCAGIDFGPSAIEYATTVTRKESLPCRFELADLRRSAFDPGQDLVMLNYGQLNVFRRTEARDLVARAYDALRPGGTLLLEVQSFDQVRGAEGAAPTWFTADGGLFADGPHIVLHERFWNEATRSSIERWHVVLPSGSVERLSLTTEAYSRREIADLVRSAGFCPPVFHESFGETPVQEAMYVALSEKG